MKVCGKQISLSSITLSVDYYIWSVKNDLNAKPINDDEGDKGNIVNKNLNSPLDIHAGMEEDIVNDSAFQPSPQSFNEIEVWAVRRQKFQV